MIYSRAKVQGQRSVGSEDRVETKGRTEERRTEAIALMRSVIMHILHLSLWSSFWGPNNPPYRNQDFHRCMHRLFLVTKTTRFQPFLCKLVKSLGGDFP